MESPDYRALIRRSTELRARSAQARKTSEEIIADSKEPEARTALLREYTPGDVVGVHDG